MVEHVHGQDHIRHRWPERQELDVGLNPTLGHRQPRGPVQTGEHALREVNGRHVATTPVGGQLAQVDAIATAQVKDRLRASHSTKESRHHGSRGLAANDHNDWRAATLLASR